jgi:integrase
VRVLASTVAEYVEHHIETLEKTGSAAKSTTTGYRFMLAHIKSDPIGGVSIDELTAEDAERWIGNMLSSGKSAATVRKAFNVLHVAVRHAVEVHRLPYDPLSAVKRPKLPKKEPNSLDTMQRARLVSYLDATGCSPVNVAISLALYTGMREGEVCGLRWADVDFKTKTLHIRRTIARDGSRTYVKEPKTVRSMRNIPIDQSLSDLLTTRMETVNAECTVAGIKFSEDMYVVGGIGDGVAYAYMDPHFLWQSWKAIAKSLDLKGTQGKVPTFHDLRHTYATAAIANGADVKSVQGLLGHASAKTTLDIYAGNDDEAMRRAAESTAAAMREVPEGAKTFK